MKTNSTNGICQLCHKIQEDENYRFCGIKCNWIYYQIKKMNHQFIKSLDSPNCAFDGCNRPYLHHTAAARCESCNKCASCDLVDNLLLCNDCALAVKSKHFDLIQQSRVIDQTIRKAQDFHNAKTISFIEIRKAIEDNQEIANKDEAYKNEILVRYEHLSVALFRAENEVYDMQIEKSLLNHELDKLAFMIRTEERERIKVADANYIPPVKAPKTIKPKIVKEKISVFDQMVKQLAEMRNISETEARLIIQQGANKMGKKIDA